MAKGETEDLVKKEVISDWFSFRMFLHTSLYGCHYILRLVLKFERCMSEIVNLEEVITSSTIWSPFLRVLLVN